MAWDPWRIPRMQWDWWKNFFSSPPRPDISVARHSYSHFSVLTILSIAVHRRSILGCRQQRTTCTWCKSHDVHQCIQRFPRCTWCLHRSTHTYVSTHIRKNWSECVQTTKMSCAGFSCNNQASLTVAIYHRYSWASGLRIFLNAPRRVPTMGAATTLCIY